MLDSICNIEALHFYINSESSWKIKKEYFSYNAWQNKIIREL